jgi:4-alpha-glucanotransferase
MRRNELKNAKKYRGQLKASVVGFLQKQKFLKTRKPNAREVLQALLAWLRTGKAELTLVTMEDLWLEMRPQNVPGTSSERPNWRRKAKLSLDQIVNDARLRKLIPR